MGSFNWPVVQVSATNPSVGTNNAAIPTSSTLVGGSDGTNIRPLKVDSSGNLNALPLPAGAATAAKQDTGNTSVASIDAKTPALGQALAAASVPVTLTALEEGLIGALTEAAPATDTASSGMNGRLQRIAQRLTSLIALLPGSLGQKAMAASLAVTVASDQSAVPVSGTVAATQSGSWIVKDSVASTSTLSNVSSSATNVTLLASNANRLGATFYNDSTQICYLKFGATASSTSYTVQLVAGAYYELPPAHIYTGIIDGLWASANGSMRVTELS